MKKFLMGVSALALAIPTMALAAPKVGDNLGTSEAEVRAALEAAGYTVKAIEVDGNEIEADVSIGGENVEVEVASDTGDVVDVESEDDDGANGEDNDDDEEDNDDDDDDGDDEQDND